MGIYDYIIVGGGISGLFMAYKLADTGKDILLVESTGRLGGRLLTKQEHGVQFEVGAARISSTHSKVMSLLKECELDKELVPLPDKVTYKIKGPTINFYSLVKDLNEGSKLYTKKYLQSINLLQLCIDVLGQPYAELFQNMLGYDSEFETFNAHSALKIFSKDLFSANDYFVLKRGFSSLVQRLQEKLEQQDNVTIMVDTLVTDIGKNFIHLHKQKLYGGYILCCVPYYTLNQYPKFKDIQEIHSVTAVPLLRIYAKYPKDKSGKVWFHNLHRTITDSYIRHIIPIDYEKGLIMISYTDGKCADMWNNLSTLGNNVLIDHLHTEVKKILGKEPPQPEFITYHYWPAGVHMWKPGQNVKEVYHKILKPFADEKIYIVNEAYSLHQCWVEGSLDACYDVLDMIGTTFVRGKPKKGVTSRSHKDGSNKVSKGKGSKGKGSKVNTVKVFSLQQVLKKRNWIVLDIRGKLRIYDVGEWLHDHPGGETNLRKGIKANRHYLNKKKHPLSPIQLFKQVDRHSSGNVIQTMLMKDNDKVVFIGVMKNV